MGLSATDGRWFWIHFHGGGRIRTADVFCYHGAMQVHCLGTAGYHPSETRHTSCYMLPESGVVLDAGTGFFRVAERIQTRSLDILLSHAHLDHVVGLTFLLGTIHQRTLAGEPLESIRIWGQEAKLAAVRSNMLAELLFPADLPVTWHAIDSESSFCIQPVATGSHSVGSADEFSIEVTWKPQYHPGQSVAYRLDWISAKTKRRLVYATDTTGATDAETLRWLSAADLMLHECNFSTK
ncbi:MAG: MBL fold metallo-hydrolase, partial [Planctomycetota bacterium]